MIGYDYPTFYRCASCDATIALRRTDLRGLPSNPDGRSRHEVVLEQHGWRGSEDALFCPDCIRGTSTAEG